MLKLLLLFLVSSCAEAAGTSVAITSQAAVTVTTTSTLSLPANPKRHYLMVQNNGTGAVTLTFNTAQVGAEGIVIGPGGNFEPFVAPVSAVYLKSAAGTQSVTIVSGN